MKTTPALLARLVFDGKADRDTATKPPGGTVEQPLEQCLGTPHCEALTAELHQRLQRMYSMDSSAVEVEELCARVERLCQWRWGESSQGARFFWAAGWLHELADRPKNAIEFYDVFLLMSSPDAHLRLLALNNRGVLQIRLGRLDGVQDLARAALGAVRTPGKGREAEDRGRTAENGEQRTASQPVGGSGPSFLRDPIRDLRGLPAACFNLLNLINTCFGAADLRRAVDEELAAFFGRLPGDLSAWWLGDANGGHGTEGTEQKTKNAEPGAAPAWGSRLPSSVFQDPSSVLGDSCAPILRDPSYRRLNMLMTRLAAQAQGLAGGIEDRGPRTEDRVRSAMPSSVFRPSGSVLCRLALWDCRLAEDRPGSPGADHPGDHFVEGRHECYAEAAGLLLSSDVPSSLSRQENPWARLQQSAQEELAVIESHLAAGQYELARSRLQVQRKILMSLEGCSGLAGLLAHVDAQLARVAHLEAQEEQLELQRTCAWLVAEVEQFCTSADPGQAERTREDLSGRLEQCRARLSSPVHDETITLLDGLKSRIEQHVHELRRARIEQETADLRRHIRQNLPPDPTKPVPESVYRALAQCRLQDPEGWIEDWDALAGQLDGRQGQYHLHQALSNLQAGRVCWARVRNDLIAALVCDPRSWLTLAPWFGLRTGEGAAKGPGEVHHQLGDRRSTLDRAGQLLATVQRQIGTDARKCLRLWESVEMTLSPALAGQDVEMLAEVRALAERCLSHWPVGLPETPGRADPRNPVHRFLEACEKAGCLLEAERLLSVRPPRADEAGARLAGILETGLDTHSQLKRAVTALYLASFHEKDPPAVQRQVLARLEAWVGNLPRENVPQILGQQIMEQTEKARTEVV